MFKRILFLLAICVVAQMAHTANGDWRIHPFYVGKNIKNIIDTDKRVYFLVGNDLFSLDKEAKTTESLTKRTRLNEVLVNNIYYNHEKKYLVVTYVNSNIDVIDEQGNVINLPDIKDAVITGLKGINDVTFSNGKMWVATEFGFMTYDEQTWQVAETRLFNTNYQSVATMGEWTLLVSSGGYAYAARTGATNETASSYTRITDLASKSYSRLYPLTDRKFMIASSAGLVTYVLGDSLKDGKTLTFYFTQSDTITKTRPTVVQKTPSGYVVSFATGSSYITLDAEGNNPQTISLTKELVASNPNGDGSLWGLSAQGVRLLSTDTYYKPNGVGIGSGAFYTTYNPGQNLTYVHSSSDNMFAEWGSQQGAVTQIFTYDGSQWTDATPSSLPGSGTSSNWQLVMDPLDSQTYVYPSRKYGVMKVKAGEIVTRYNASNSNFGGSLWYKGACAFDSQGNLWVVYSSEKASAASSKNVAVLPRAQYEKTTSTVSDWITVDVPGTKQKFFKGSSFAIGNGDVKVYNGGGYQGKYAFWAETDGLGSEPKLATFNSFQDQDGGSITWSYVYCMTTDFNGRVWTGYSGGVVAFDPARAFDDDFAVDHLKVPRSDGTGLYDYLLDGLQVNCIAVDAANRKWIGTNSSGLYQVSADGSKILKQFNVDNSYLTSNTIYGVSCNTATNSVMAVTPTGCVEFMADGEASASNYDNVYVYPNPVRPDFTGFLTISNLMSDSYVTIRDGSGTVVKQLVSNGGTAVWDCCDDAGERMPTGLYHVYASQQPNDTNAKKVAEFLIIK